MIEPEATEIALNKFKAAAQVFHARVQGSKLMCRIYDKFAGPDQANHNCLGCNFDEATGQACAYLDLISSASHELSDQDMVSMYALLINSLWERISDVFNIVSVPEAYRCRHYDPFIRMRRWANFFKHPKEFGWLVHHPLYVFEDSAEADLYRRSEDVRRIDDDFLRKYYSAERSKGLAAEFTNRETKVVVLLPDVESLTVELCDSLENFVSVVVGNPVYVEILNDRSTVSNYFESQRQASKMEGADGGS